MNLRSKIFLTFFTPAFLLGPALMWNIKSVTHRTLMEDLERRGKLSIDDLVTHAAPGLIRNSEKELLPFLQMAHERSGAVAVFLLGPTGIVIAHTNVGEKGQRYLDRDTQDAIRATASFVRASPYRDAPALRFYTPVWSVLRPGNPEEMMWGASEEPSAKSRIGTACQIFQLKDILETENRIFREISLLFILSGLVGGIGVLFFIRRLMNPVQHLSQGTSQIARGEYGAQVPVLSDDELGRLAQDFNSMSRSLAESTVSKKAYQQSEQRFLSMADSIEDTFWLFDHTQNRVIYLSKSFETIWGLNRDAVYHDFKRIYSSILFEDRARFREAIGRIATERFDEVFRIKRADGELRWIHARGFPVRDDGGAIAHIAGVARDVTADHESSQTRSLLFTAIEQSKDAIVITSSEGIIEYVNRSFESLTGYNRNEAIGKNPRILKSGKLSPAHYQSLWSTIKSGRIWEGLFINRRKDGTLFEEEACIGPVTDQTGKITHFVAVKRDISERRQMENALRRSDKLAAVGQLAAGVAHELNNPLGVILGFSQSIARRLPPQDPMEMPIKSIEKEALRCRDLVRDLLTFSRTSKVEREAIDLNQTIDIALSLVSTQAKMKQFEIVRDLAPGLAPMFANANQIQQILINLATNAFDAMGDSGVLTVKTAGRRHDSLDWVDISVQDTGTGIPAEILPRIFDPFFTTKPVGKGTGLGLSLIHEIVQKHSGTIHVESRPGHTVFRIQLPVTPIENGAIQ